MLPDNKSGNMEMEIERIQRIRRNRARVQNVPRTFPLSSPNACVFMTTLDCCLFRIACHNNKMHFVSSCLP